MLQKYLLTEALAQNFTKIFAHEVFYLAVIFYMEKWKSAPGVQTVFTQAIIK